MPPSTVLAIACTAVAAAFVLLAAYSIGHGRGYRRGHDDAARGDEVLAWDVSVLDDPYVCREPAKHEPTMN